MEVNNFFVLYTNRPKSISNRVVADYVGEDYVSIAHTVNRIRRKVYTKATADEKIVLYRNALLSLISETYRSLAQTLTDKYVHPKEKIRELYKTRPSVLGINTIAKLTGLPSYAKLDLSRKRSDEMMSRFWTAQKYKAQRVKLVRYLVAAHKSAAKDVDCDNKKEFLDALEKEMIRWAT